MKNKFITFFLVILFTLSNFSRVLGEEFIFEISDLEITENGNIYKGNNRGTIRTDSQLKLISDNFEYLKEINRLEANGDVQLFDLNNNITINAQQIFYLKNEEKIFTVGKTLIKISNKYNIEGFDLILFKNKMILSSKKNAIITDNESNTYKLEQFQYSINQEILKGENIVAITSDKENKSDEFFFKTGFFDLKKNEFLGKDITANFHKDLFGDNENDPRISAVSGFGDKINTYFKKGVFTSCKKTDKCPPWKITSDEIHHDKIKKQINYKNAWLEIYDFPVVYFPKFFHPDPSVKRQSGLLMPEFGSSNNLGSSIYVPYFLAISDDKDLTIKPRLFRDNKFLLQNEYRQKTKNSFTIADFSIVNGHDSSAQDKGGTRSHLFTNTLVDLSLDNFKKSMLQIKYQKVSNDNYLKLFDLQSPLLLDDNSVLESKIQFDLEHESYDLTTSFEIYESLNGSNSDRYQYVLPSYDFSKNFSLNNIDGSFNFNSYGNNTLTDTNVVGSTISNDLIYSALGKFFDNGIKTNFEIALKKEDTSKINTLLKKWHRIAKQKKCNAVLSSAEALVHQLGQQRKLNFIVNSANSVGYTNIKAMGFFRDLSDHALSTYKHRAKSGKIPDYEHWVKNVYETPKLLEKLTFVITHNQGVKWTLRKFQKDSNFLKENNVTIVAADPDAKKVYFDRKFSLK